MVRNVPSQGTSRSADIMKHPAGLIWRAFSIAALCACVAAGTLAFAQNSDPNANAPDSNGGWKRVGDHAQVNQPAPDPDSPSADPNAPPPPAYPPANNGRGSYP